MFLLTLPKILFYLWIPMYNPIHEPNGMFYLLMIFLFILLQFHLCIYVSNPIYGPLGTFYLVIPTHSSSVAHKQHQNMVVENNNNKLQKDISSGRMYYSIARVSNI